jgi:hypothetical protein
LIYCAHFGLLVVFFWDLLHHQEIDVDLPCSQRSCWLFFWIHWV